MASTQNISVSPFRPARRSRPPRYRSGLASRSTSSSKLEATHGTREPLLRASQDLVPTIRRIVLRNQYHRENYEVVELSVRRHKGWGPPYRRPLHEAGISERRNRTAI